jgi:hypothetical protein
MTVVTLSNLHGRHLADPEVFAWYIKAYGPEV